LLYHTSYFVQEGSPDNLQVLKDLYISLFKSPISARVYEKEALIRYITNYAEFFASDKAKGSPLYYRWRNPQEGVSFFTSIRDEI